MQRLGGGGCGGYLAGFISKIIEILFKGHGLKEAAEIGKTFLQNFPSANQVCEISQHGHIFYTIFNILFLNLFCLFL